MEFLRASENAWFEERRQQERQRSQKQRIRSAILGIACVVLLVAAAVFATLYQKAEAERAKPYIKIWKVGSPYRGDLPSFDVPVLESEAASKGRKLRLEAFPAEGFVEKFFEAFEKQEAPDILAIDNWGIIEGRPGAFKGIGADKKVLQSLIMVTTDSLKELEGPPKVQGGPHRGWEFFIATSRNYEAAKSLALPSYGAIGMGSLKPLTVDLNQIVASIGSSYFKSAIAVLQPYEDSAYLSAEATVQQDVQILATIILGYWGNDHLAFVPVIFTFQRNETGPGTVKIKNEIGSATVLLILRKQLNQWKLLTATTDPISTDTFMRDVPRLANLLNKQWNSVDKPNPAELLAPANRQFPQPTAGQRFGEFSWQPSKSTNVVAEIAEFAYTDSKNEARLFIRFRSRENPVKEQISAGQLWTTHSQWQWRIWSISDAGDVALSESRSFPN